MERGRITIVPCTFSEASAFITEWHRHHRPPVGHKFSVALADEAGKVRGVATVGRPISRRLDDEWTLEVTLVATDGCANATSALYGACRRAAWAMGYRRLITYTLPSEGGASLRGTGWSCVGEVGGGSWSRESRPRVDAHPLDRKMRWEAQALFAQAATAGSEKSGGDGA